MHIAPIKGLYLARVSSKLPDKKSRAIVFALVFATERDKGSSGNPYKYYIACLDTATANASSLILSLSQQYLFWILGTHRGLKS